MIVLFTDSLSVVWKKWLKRIVQEVSSALYTGQLRVTFYWVPFCYIRDVSFGPSPYVFFYPTLQSYSTYCMGPMNHTVPTAASTCWKASSSDCQEDVRKLMTKWSSDCLSLAKYLAVPPWHHILRWSGGNWLCTRRPFLESPYTGFSLLKSDVKWKARRWVYLHDFRAARWVGVTLSRHQAPS